MINKKHFLKTNKAGFVLGAVLLAALAESAGRAGVTVEIGVPVPVVVVAPPVVVAAPAVVIVDDFIFYPNYAIYFNSSRHQYAYLEGGAWIFAAAPVGVTIDVLVASPSIHMDWHDSPANHHSEMIKKYPGNRKAAAVHQERKEEQKEQPKAAAPGAPGHGKK
jgi:hypothetical protein